MAFLSTRAEDAKNIRLAIGKESYWLLVTITWMVRRPSSVAAIAVRV